MKEIIITIDDAGETSIDIKGYAGKGCEQAMKDLADPDATVTKKRVKPELYQDARQQEKLQS